MHIVIVNEGIPYPPTAGNRIRTLNLLVRLARRHQIAYICRGSGDAAETQSAVEHLAQHGIPMIVADDGPPPKKGVGFYARLAANLLSPEPYAIASHNSPAIWRAVRDYAAQYDVDLWQAEWLPYAEAVCAIPQARTVMMAHNVESLIWQRYTENERHPLKRWYLKQQWRKFEVFERRIFQNVGRVVTVSPDDAELTRNRFGIENVSVVENGIDGACYLAVKREPDPRRVLFLGSLDWRPNLDAVRLLVEQIFPAVIAQEAAAKLCIVGRRPPEWLRQRASQHPWLEVHADVPDVRPYLAKSGIMTVPLRIGGGSRLKILESLAAGLPVVSTRVGAEGLALKHGREITLVEQVEQMAEVLIEGIRHPERLQETGKRGQKLVLESYDWDVLALRLEAIWVEVAAAPTSTCLVCQ